MGKKMTDTIASNNLTIMGELRSSSNKMNGYRTLPCSLSFREAAAASLSRSDHGKDDSWGQPQSSPSLDYRQVTPISHSTPSSSSSKKSRKKRSSSKASSKSPGSKSSSKSGSKSSSKSSSRSRRERSGATAKSSLIFC